MTKMKTKKAVTKKFKVSATGKLKFRHPGKRHKLTNKSHKGSVNFRLQIH